MTPQTVPNIGRRQVLGAMGAGAAALATSPTAASVVSAGAQTKPAAPGRTRTVPRTGQALTQLGLGTFLTFDALPGTDRARLHEVVRRHIAGGGRVIDTSPLYGSAEVSVGAVMASLAEADDLFVANKIWSTGEYLGDESHAAASLQQSRLRLWRDKIDLMQCHSLINAGVIIPLLQAWKQEGRIGLVGATHHESGQHDALAEVVDSGAIDVVQANYSIFDRAAEHRLLPAAAERGVGVVVNLPLEKARLTHIVEGRPLPDFAADFGATSWAQFFLKWVMAHPAVTTVLCGTSNPDHAADNTLALHGPLPDEAMRQRMVRHMETIPGFAEIGRTPWYPGKETQYHGLIATAQAATRARLQR